MCFVLFFTIVTTQSFAASNERAMIEGSRVAASKDFIWVGKLMRRNSFFCAAWILDHGVAITAKHCFQHQSFDSVSAAKGVANFSLLFGTSENLVTISELTEIQFDSGQNDIVIVKYKENFTSGKIPLPAHEIFRDTVPRDIALTVVGFPGPKFQRVATINCRTTGFRGSFAQTPFDAGYEGVFEDTTCGAWYGVSGGPVFHENADGSIVLYGVLTHTFAVVNDGNLDSKYLIQDQFGSAAPGMFSAFGLSLDL